MIRIQSDFDNRLSSITDLFPSIASSASDEDERSDLESRLDSAEKVILHWDFSNSDSLIFESSQGAAAEYLSAVDEILSLADDSDSTYDISGRAESVLQIAMSRLEEEFRHLMIRNTVPLDANGRHSSIRRLSLPFSSDSGETLEYFEERGGSTDLIRPQAVSDLKEIADRMIRSGYGKDLCEVYCGVQREIMDECLSVLGVDGLSIEEVQKIEWSTLDDKMKTLIPMVKVVIWVLISGMRRLCDQIFAASDEQLKVECFTESAKGCVMQLLNFGDAIAIGRRSLEKLFWMLDMYDALNDVMLDLKELFYEDSREFICGEAEDLLSKLGDAVRGTLADSEFGDAVQKETTTKPMQGGEIHPWTRYVMNYVKLLVDYSGTLDSLLEDSGVDGGDQPEDSESMTPLGHRFQLLISNLESDLEEKSKLHEDGAMQYIFLMNNKLYIVQKVKDSELGTLLGDHWVRKRCGQIRQYATSYLRASFTKVLSYLKFDRLDMIENTNSVLRVTLKDRFKNFNLAFEEIYTTQKAWKVPDPRLREELRISISQHVIPAYRSFVRRFGAHLEAGRHPAKYIKYTPEDLMNHLLDLFE